MWFGIQLGPFIAGGSTRRSADAYEDAGTDDWDRLTLGGWRLVLGFVAVICVATVCIFAYEWITYVGAVKAALTAFWVIVGIPLLLWVMWKLGR